MKTMLYTPPPPPPNRSCTRLLIRQESRWPQAVPTTPAAILSAAFPEAKNAQMSAVMLQTAASLTTMPLRPLLPFLTAAFVAAVVVGFLQCCLHGLQGPGPVCGLKVSLGLRLRA